MTRSEFIEELRDFRLCCLKGLDGPGPLDLKTAFSTYQLEAEVMGYLAKQAPVAAPEPSTPELVRKAAAEVMANSELRAAVRQELERYGERAPASLGH